MGVFLRNVLGVFMVFFWGGGIGVNSGYKMGYTWVFSYGLPLGDLEKYI